MMGRMRRWLLSFLTCLSLLLALGTVGLWVRSYWTRDIISWGRSGWNSHTLQSILGRVHVVSYLDDGSFGGFHHREDKLAPSAIWNGAMSSYPRTVEWHFGHVFQKYQRQHYDLIGGGRGGMWVTNHRLIVIPYWSPAVLFSILPAVWVWRLVRGGRRRKVGHCPRCDYDLRATPERCPECGWLHSSDKVTSSLVPSTPSGPRE
jgi:hypothetical protein